MQIPKEADTNSLVAKFIDLTGDCNSRGTGMFLPSNIISEILHTHVPKANTFRDTLSWEQVSNGQFSIKAAYKWITRADIENPLNLNWD